MAAAKILHQILDAIFDSGDEEFSRATDLILRTQFRGVVSRQHALRFPHSSEEAVRFALLSRRASIRQPGRKNNG